jgi:hypothetical protein
MDDQREAISLNYATPQPRQSLLGAVMWAVAALVALGVLLVGVLVIA